MAEPSPPADEAQRLLREVIARPQDDAPRLVYADFLMQRDDPRGELIATQLKLRTRVNPALRATLRAREQALLRALPRGLAGPAATAELCLRRGFVDEVKVPAGRLGALDPLLLAEPVTRLRLLECGQGAVESLLASVVWGRLSLLQLRGALGEGALESLAASAGLQSLRALNLYQCDLSARALAALVTSPNLRVQRLTLTHNPLGDAGAQVIADQATAQLRQACRELYLARCDLKPRGAEAILRAWPELRRLGLGGNPLDTLTPGLEAALAASTARVELTATPIGRDLRRRLGERIVV